MTNNNITDFINDEYIDYLETIPENKLKPCKSSIYSILLERDSEKIFEYIFNRLPIDYDYFLTTIFHFQHKKISLSAIKFFEKKFDLTIKFQENHWFKVFVSKYKLDVCKYIYENYRQNKIEEAIPKELNTVICDKFEDSDVFIWLKSLRGLEPTSNEKYLMVNKIFSKGVWYERNVVLTVSLFKEILNKVNLSVDDFIKIFIKNNNQTTISNFFSKADNELIEWFFDKVGIDNKDIFNTNFYPKILTHLLSNNLNKESSQLNKIKLLFSYANIHKIKINLDLFEHQIGDYFSAKTRFNSDLNDEIAHEIIKLGIIPKKTNKYYDYYKQISIIN
jgi:hypothetical protein